jgi:hypothetical protein
MRKNASITMSLFRLLVAALALTVLASACGGGDDAAEPADDAEVAASGRAFCDIFREQDARSDSFDPFSTEPAEVEAFFDNQLALLTEAIASVPSAEIKADLELIQVGQIEMASMLEAVAWDVFAVDFAAVEEINEQPEMNAASDRLDIYGETECGIRPDDDDDDDDGDGDGDAAEDGNFGNDPEMLAMLLENPVLRGLMIEEMTSESDVTEEQANCFFDGLIDSGLFEAVGGNMDELGTAQMITMLEIFDDCGIDPNTFG